MNNAVMRPLSIFLICFLGAIAFANSLHCSFHFDDYFFIVDNTAIRNIHDLAAIWKYLPCRFIFYLSLALNYHFSQLNVLTYHLVNISVHLINAVLVWWLVLLTLQTPVFKKEPIHEHANLIALFAGLIFVTHPIQTQGVDYIMQRSACMVGMFYLASLCLYAKSRMAQRGQGIYYAAAVLTALLAMFTKEISITLPLMLLLYEFSFLRTEKRFEWSRLAPFLLMLLIIPVTMFFTHKESINTHEIHNAIADKAEISSTQYLLTQFRVVTTYIRLLFLPIHQNLDYDYALSHSLLELPTLISFLFLMSIFGFAVWSFSKYRLIAFAIFWFFLSLIPESSVFAIKDVIFEHRLYLPMVGCSIFLAAGMYYLLGKKAMNVMILVLTIIVLGCIVLTYQRNKVWKDEITLWSDAAQKSPHKTRPFYNRGRVWAQQGKFTQAIADFNKAVEINPKYSEAYNNLGFIYDQQGKSDLALLNFTKAIETDSKDILAYDNRGLLYNKQNNLDKAVDDFNKEIALDPQNAKAYNNLGLVFDKEHKFNEAVSYYNKAIAIKPDYTQAYNNRGNAYDKLGKTAKAVLDYNKVMTLDPKLTEAYYNRGNVFAHQGKFNEAIVNYNKALKTKSHYAEIYFSRGFAYDKLGNRDQAINDYTQAIALKADYAQAYYNRGLMYADEGKIDEAMADYNAAIKMDPGFSGAYNSRGSAYAQQGKFNDALADFSKAIEINPKSVEAYSNRGLAYDRIGQGPQAMADYNKGIEIDPHYAQIYNNRGSANLEQGKVDEALADYDKAIEINPNYAEGYINRGNAYAKANNLTQAVADYSKSIEINPYSGLAYNNQAILYYQLKEYDKAWDDVHRLQKLGGSVNPGLLSALTQATGQ